MKKQIPSHEIPRSISWLSIRLEARINEEIKDFLDCLQSAHDFMERTGWPKQALRPHWARLRKIARKLEPVLYIVEFQNKDAAESIKAFLEE